MNEEQGLSTEEKAYFDSRGEDTTALKAEPEAPAVETPEPEVVADDTAGQDDDAAAREAVEQTTPKPRPMVPLAALTETRGELKELKTKLAETEKRSAILEDRWNQLLQQAQPKQPAQQAEEIPDPDENPHGAIAWATKQIAEMNAAKAAEAQKTEAQRAADTEWQQVYSAVNTQYAESVKADPLIDQARDYMIDSLGNECLAMGMTREQAQAEISRIEAQHIRHAHAKGIPIGDYVRGLATARGWQGKAKAADPAADAGADLDKLAEAVDASTSLSAAGGGAPRARDPKMIADMSPAEFERWLSKNGTDAFRKLAGG